MKKKDYIIPNIKVIKMQSMRFLMESLAVKSTEKASDEEVGW